MRLLKFSQRGKIGGSNSLKEPFILSDILRLKWKQGEISLKNHLVYSKKNQEITCTFW